MRRSGVDHAAVGAPAPHFVLPDTDGREHSFPRDFDGRPGLLVFCKSTCATCDLAFPYINRLPNLYGEGCEIWTVAQDEPQRAAEYARRMAIPGPVLVDAPDYAVSRLYNPPATPTVFLVRADGRIDYSTHGFAKDDLNEVAAAGSIRGRGAGRRRSEGRRAAGLQAGLKPEASAPGPARLKSIRFRYATFIARPLFGVLA